MIIHSTVLECKIINQHIFIFFYTINTTVILTISCIMSCFYIVIFRCTGMSTMGASGHESSSHSISSMMLLRTWHTNIL